MDGGATGCDRARAGIKDKAQPRGARHGGRKLPPGVGFQRLPEQLGDLKSGFVQTGKASGHVLMCLGSSTKKLNVKLTHSSL